MKTRETKTHFYQCFPLVWPKQGKPCERARPDVCEMLSCSSFEGFEPELLAVKVWWKLKKKFYGEEALKKITRPQDRFLSSETNSTAFSHGGDDMLFVSELKTQNCGRVIFFWRLVFSMTDQFFRTRPSLTAYNSRSKPHTPNKFHIFGNVRTWGFTWT